MLIRYPLLLVLFFPAIGFSQSSIQNENDLVAAIVALQPVEKTMAVKLVEEHKDLVTTVLWERLVETAIAASRAGNMSRAFFILDVARDVAAHLNERKLVASTIYYVGKLHSDAGHNKAAITAYIESKQIFEAVGSQVEVSYLLSELSALYLFAADYQKAQVCAAQSLALAEVVGDAEGTSVQLIQRSKAAALSTLGNLSKQDGEYDQALTYLQQTLTLFRQLDGERTDRKSDVFLSIQLDEGSSIYKVEIAYALTDIGRIYRVMGDHLQALHYLTEALTLAKSRNMKFAFAGALNSLGILYIEQGDYTKASDFLHQSLEASRRDNDSLGVARVPVNLGVIHQRLANYEEALNHYQTALKRAEAISATEIIIAAQQGLGAVHQERGEYVTALEWLEKALLAAQTIGDKTRIAEILWLKAEAYYLNKELPQALDSATAAAELAGRLHLPVISYLALTTKGKCFLAQKKDDLAIRHLSLAIEQIESMRSLVAGGEQERQLFFENKVTPYNLMIELLTSQQKPGDALLFAERSKARVLLEVLTNGGRVNVTKAMSVRETAEEQRLNRTIVGLNDRIRSENLKPAPDAGLLKNLEVRLNSARIEYEHFQNVLYTTHPQLRIQRGHTPALTLDTIASTVADKETAFLEYVVTKESAFLFVITKEDQVGNLNLRMYPLNVKGSDLVKKASRFRQLMADRHPIFSALSLELYDLLIKPAEAQLQGKRTLCIIPDGALWHVSFQALQSIAGHFLLEDYAVYYTPSLGVLREMAKPGSGSAKDARPSLIAFGNPTAGKEWVAGLREANRGKNFDPLPEAEVEVMALEEMFGRANSKVFIGAKANEPNFKSLAPAYDTIHLATHGVLDDRHPLYSYLLLAKADGEVVKEDGLLEAREIINMNIGADLVVLSACETARGRVGAGEGIIGMSWAFFIAGSRTTVVSQWKVNSAGTSKLMVNFYRHLQSAPAREGGTKASALRQAALELMKDGRYRHPFYWAGFVIIGSNG